MKIFLSTCLLLAILFPVSAVKTLMCLESSRRIPGDRLCSIKGGNCFVQKTQFYFNGSLDTTQEWGCATNCPSNFSITTEQGPFRQRVTHCCQRSRCNGKGIEMPRRMLNGLQCPVLGPSGLVVSTAPKPIKCYNDETRCLEFVFVRDDKEAPNKVTRACATPSFCEMVKKSVHRDAFNGTITQARCSDSLPSS